MTTRHQNEGEPQPQDALSVTPDVSAAKKTFVEPKISNPVDVLEATTYFQTVDSGGTGLRKLLND